MPDMFDSINALFEIVGSCVLWLSVRALYQAKGYAGVHIAVMCLYTVWGGWNLIYYPHLEQWVSFVAAFNVLAANFTWICLAFRYGKLDL